MKQSSRNLGYMLHGFYATMRRMDDHDEEDNFDKLLGRMNKNELFNNDCENYNKVVDFCISLNPNFEQLEDLSQAQIDYLIREVDQI